MSETLLFCLVFLCQLLLISHLCPRRVISRARYVLRNFSPVTHPKLYPQPPEEYERWVRNIARLDLSIVVAGLVAIGLILGTFAGGWNDGRWHGVIVTAFFVVQFVGLVGYINFSSRKFLRALANATPPRVRTTELRRRRLVDFASPAMFAVAALLNTAFVAFVLYCWRLGFPWLTGSKAAVFIGAIGLTLLAFTVSVAVALRAPKTDPYQAHQDRLDVIRLVVRQALTVCIALPVLMAAVVVTNLFEPGALRPVVASLFMQSCALALLWPSYRYRAENIDFDVYRPDASGASPVR